MEEFKECDVTPSNSIEVMESCFFICEGVSYVLVLDKNNHQDLLTFDTSLKSKKLAKETATKLIKAIGYEDGLSKIPPHTNRKSPHTDKVLEFLRKVVENEI